MALAASLHAAPGVYAFLVGSGMSRAAQIPTGWDVVIDLVRRVGIAEGIPAELLQDPIGWWTSLGHAEARYDELLRALAPTDAARRALLRGYFDPPVGLGGPLLPTEAHRALAELVKVGRVRVIVTTNFDHLIEHALTDVGVAPQIIHNPSTLKGMTPLEHAPCTLIKVHGDYATGSLRNIAEELADYPRPLQRLLEEVFDRYGLLVVGWSGDYDRALVDVISRASTRRYPTYWGSHGSRPTSETARNLIALRQAVSVPIAGADDFMTDIVERLAKLDAIAAMPKRPRPSQFYQMAPEQTVCPPGWDVLPLLHIRAATRLGPVDNETVGLIGPDERDVLLEALSHSALIHRIVDLVPRVIPMWGGSNPPEANRRQYSISTHWGRPPGPRQDTGFAVYRVGGDGSEGLSGLLTVQSPQVPPVTRPMAEFTIKADIGLSVKAPLALVDAALLLRDALLLITSTVPQVLTSVIPPATGPNHIELHLAASPRDGTSLGTPRENNLTRSLALAEVEEPPDRPPEMFGVAFELRESPIERDATQLVFDGLRFMLLSAGYLNPRRALHRLASELDVVQPGQISLTVH